VEQDASFDIPMLCCFCEIGGRDERAGAIGDEALRVPS
jgi:hypothetical protein